jgi:asparagine synthase (glutamine-hydrolysing)
MCGIAGAIGFEDISLAESSVRRMVSSMERRGPDSEGIELWPAAVLGHRRLAIFDLSAAGHQPMVSEDRSVGVVFNGAIYNYLEIKHDLILRGCKFRSNTDTEVLLHGYREWGIDCLVEKLRGMFAFGLWDDEKRRLFLVRDRLGVKPLAFIVGHGSIAFASTPRALRNCGWTDELNPSAVLEFLEYGYLTDERSIYSNVFKAPAATIIEWSNGALKERRYWSPPWPNEERPETFENALERVEELLIESVKLRLRADVPVGVLLSGGIDSGLVCWAVARLGGNATAYTIGTPGIRTDETSDAKKTADKLALSHQIIDLSDNTQPEMKELVSAYSEPFASPSALGMLALSRTISHSAKVILTGDGGDDIFLGYPRHRHLFVANLLAKQMPGGMKKAWLASRKLVPRIGVMRRSASLMDYVSGDLSAFATGNKLNGVLGPRLAQIAGTPHARSVPPLEKGLPAFLEYERQTQFVGEFMTKVDGATMHYGLEARSPLLDHWIWEYAASLPCSLRLQRGRLKALLRELAKRHIGSAQARRAKTGFRIPVNGWMAGEWRRHVESAFRDSMLDKEGWICSQAALKRLDTTSGSDIDPDQIWNIFVLESWLRNERLSEN